MAHYTIGVDFGTLSGRAVLVDVSGGAELAASALAYPHGVMDKTLPDGTLLPVDWALQHPQDYLDVLRATIPAVIRQAGVTASDIIGIGIDFTACTMLPVLADGTPLSSLPHLEREPHAYVKLWKHHAAQDQARRITELAQSRGEAFLARYGGIISSEWALAKIWQVLEEAPEVYGAADFFIEAADWVVWQLTGVRTRNACCAGYKALYHKQEGYPSRDFLKVLDPGLETLFETKMGGPLSPLGGRAGEITPDSAAWTGLRPGTAVAVANVDAHVTVPAVGITGPGNMLAIMGTSTCHMLVSEAEQPVPGICGVVQDGIYPGYFGYEAGQSCVGDGFAWFIENCLPPAYWDEAEARGLSIHDLLREKSERFLPGESGLLALDWWNGNRSILVDVDLSGLLIGMTLQTRPEEIYRALVEATAFGTRRIIQSFRESGVTVEAFYASGGISQKNPMIMQIYADVIGMPVHIAGNKEGPAFGSSMYGAVAAGLSRGGYDSIFDAVQRMGKAPEKIYAPIASNCQIYDTLYAEYCGLHDYFGRGGNDVMKRLKEIRKQSRAGDTREGGQLC